MVSERVGVIGAGSWGTALTKPLSDQGRDISLWGHSKEHLTTIIESRENKTYLPGYILEKNILPVFDLGQAVRGHKVIVMVVPSHVFREVFQQVVSYLDNGAYVISAAKGIENDTLLTMTQVMKDILSQVSPAKKDIRLGVLSGPSFAKEEHRVGYPFWQVIPGTIYPS